MQFVFFIALAISLLLQDVCLCPTNCSCTNNLKGTYLRCNNRRLPRIPTYMPNDTYYADLSDNKITVVESGTFKTLSKIRNLYLYDNMIAVIETGAFENMPALYELQLYQNKLAVIESGIFQNVPQLRIIYMHTNSISKIREMAFVNLSSLQVLKLQHNPLKVIEPGSFQNLPKLDYLYMDLDCDNCYIAPFYEWIRNKTSLITSPTCKDYNNTRLFDLPGNVFDECNHDVGNQENRLILYAISIVGTIAIFVLFTICGLCIAKKYKYSCFEKPSTYEVPTSISLPHSNDYDGLQTEPANLSEYEEIHDNRIYLDAVVKEPYELLSETPFRALHKYQTLEATQSRTQNDPDRCPTTLAYINTVDIRVDTK